MSRTHRKPAHGWVGGEGWKYTTDKYAGWHLSPKWYRQSFKQRDRHYDKQQLHVGNWDQPSRLLKPRHDADWSWL